MTRSQGKQSRRWAVQVCYVQDPPSTSPAQLALLAKEYFRLDKSIYTEIRMNKVRNRWMKKQLRENKDEKGGLTCVACKRQGLLPFTKSIKNRATLDHVIEIGDGGEWKNPNNFQVLCSYCHKKKNRIFQDSLAEKECFISA